MKALVTGGGGFLGSHIVHQLLQRGDDVTVFARGDYPALRHAGARLVRGDLADTRAVLDACKPLDGKNFDAVFHTAAKAGVWGSWDSFYQPNVVGTQNVITACRTHGIRQLIFTSSPSVIFDGSDHHGHNETLPYPEQHENRYSATKAIAERLVLQGHSDTLRTVALRPHLILGPGDPHLVPRLVARARAGKLIQVGNGRNRVDMTFVEDAARAHLQAADVLQRGDGTPVGGKVYFLSQGEPVVLWPWINGLLNRLNIPPVRRRISESTARRLATVLETVHRILRLGGEPRLTRFLAGVLARDHFYDISAAHRDFGYTPQATMDQVVDQVVASLRLPAAQPTA